MATDERRIMSMQYGFRTAGAGARAQFRSVRLPGAGRIILGHLDFAFGRGIWFVIATDPGA